MRNADFLELRLGEVRRIPLLRRWVNRHYSTPGGQVGGSMLGPSMGVWSAASSSPPDHRVVGSVFSRWRLKDANPPCFSHGTIGEN